jgi:hypothetical protein
VGAFEALGYRIKYKAAGTSEWTYTNSTDNQTTITGLTPNTDYGWQVKTVCSQSPIIASDSFAMAKFMTPPLRVGGEMLASEGTFAEIYPNPVQNELIISMAIPASEVTIRVYDLQGKMIELPIAIQDMQAEINTTGLAYGFYTIQITNEKTGTSVVRKFVKQSD